MTDLPPDSAAFPTVSPSECVGFDFPDHFRRIVEPSRRRRPANPIWPAVPLSPPGGSQIVRSSPGVIPSGRLALKYVLEHL
jgi:hypothetical protein